MHSFPGNGSDVVTVLNDMSGSSSETHLKASDPFEADYVLPRLRQGLWAFGLIAWVIALADRYAAAFSHGYPSAVELAHLFAIAFLLISWIWLKPEEVQEDDRVLLEECESDLASSGNPIFLQQIRQRMTELREWHMIHQEYTLPFPYLCQIFHLLNLKHLEDVHSFSLSNLRIIKVSEFQATEVGGVLKFQTVLDSPINALRIWRQPIVEVELALLTPYTVELSIPVYGDRKIVVLFNAIPMNNQEHRFLIDIYSDLEWFKPLLQVLLHLSSSLTLFEDLPYLQTLAERNLDRLVRRGKISNHDTMKLFKRFVDLYGRNLEQVYQPEMG